MTLLVTGDPVNGWCRVPAHGTTNPQHKVSAEAVGWVYRRSPYTGGTFSVHLAIADTASDVHGYEFWMALGKLARKARVTRPTCQKAIETMVADGLLTLVFQSNGGRGRPSRYRLELPDRPSVWEARAPGGDPSKLASHLAVTAPETVKSGPQTVKPVGTHRTQARDNPTRSAARFVCSDCGAGPFPTLDEYTDHLEACWTDTLPQPLDR